MRQILFYFRNNKYTCCVWLSKWFCKRY